jgi:hypothetical protein
LDRTHWEFQTKLIREIELHSLFAAQFGVQVTVRYSVEACPSGFPKKKVIVRCKGRVLRLSLAAFLINMSGSKNMQDIIEHSSISTSIKLKPYMSEKNHASCVVWN